MFTISCETRYDISPHGKAGCMRELKIVKANDQTDGKTVYPKNVIMTDEDIYNFLNNKNSLTKTIYEKLISMFMNNELIPGQILNRRQLANELGVSVAPVLEAMILLEREGFIESIPRKGTIVRPVRERDVYERYVLREALECAAARLYVGPPIQWNKDELLAYAEKIDNDERYSISQMTEEITFHASLVNLAGIPSLTREFLRATRIGMFCMINHVSFHKGIIPQNHAPLIEKLCTDNPDEAEKIIREHVWSGKPVSPKYHLVPELTRK
jgi:DNA-binding GntR family transcriptional regulator